MISSNNIKAALLALSLTALFLYTSLFKVWGSFQPNDLKQGSFFAVPLVTCPTEMPEFIGKSISNSMLSKNVYS